MLEFCLSNLKSVQGNLKQVGNFSIPCTSSVFASKINIITDLHRQTNTESFKVIFNRHGVQSN